MKFVSIREIRNHPGEVWAKLEEDDIVLTQNGKPMALMTRVGEGDFEEKMALLKRARFAKALDRIRAAASASGADRMTEQEIDAIIAETRRERPAR
jgi:antitoxin (DNA-binding transcriptional repressor) of toxin-antitoxin stability system